VFVIVRARIDGLCPLDRKRFHFALEVRQRFLALRREVRITTRVFAECSQAASLRSASGKVRARVASGGVERAMQNQPFDKLVLHFGRDRQGGKPSGATDGRGCGGIGHVVFWKRANSTTNAGPGGYARHTSGQGW